VVFAIPYEHDFSLVGTTDHDYSGDPADTKISDVEATYLLGMIRRYFAKAYSPEDIVWSYSGVRPLYDEEGGRAQDASRDYLLKYEASETTPPMLSVYGGKLTTYRRLAESAMTHLEAAFPDLKAAWTAQSHLPGGDIALDGVNEIASALHAQMPFMSHGQVRRLAEAYGTMVDDIFADCDSAADVGEDFGHGLSEAEVRHLIDNEWAQTSDDILWRRTKLGLRFTAQQSERLDTWLRHNVGKHAVESPAL
jgi:glycerol-3-phosphate dehydrogenase